MKWGALNVIFRRNDRAYTMTLSNIGPIKVEKGYEEEIEHFHLMIGVSKRQPMKCAVCAYGEHVVVTFTSVFQDTRLQDRFFGFLRELGVPVETESNGVPDPRMIRRCIRGFSTIRRSGRKWSTLLHHSVRGGGHTGYRQLRHVLRVHVVSDRHRLHRLCGADSEVFDYAPRESGF